MSQGEAAALQKWNWNTFRSSQTFIICTVAVSVFVDLFTYSLIIPILPMLLKNRIHVAPASVNINISGLLATYNASLCVGAPIVGYLADRWLNRKISLLAGLLALAGATILFMLTTSLGLLYLARALQGISASIVWTVGLALLVDTVGPEGIGPAMGWVTMGLSLGNSCGPLLGGIVYQYAGQYATFSMSLGAIMVDIVLRCILRERRPVAMRAEAAVFPAHTGTPRNSHTATQNVEGVVKSESLAHGQISLSSAVPHESNIVAHLTPPNKEQLDGLGANINKASLFSMFRLLKYSVMLSSLWNLFLITSVLNGLEAEIPQHVETTFHWSSTGAGLIYLAIIAPTFLSPIIGRLSGRVDTELTSAIGFVLVVIFGPLLAIVRSYSIGLIVALIIFLIATGLGIFVVTVPEMAKISSFAEVVANQDSNAFDSRRATAQSCALLTIVMALAGVAGPLICGAVQTDAGWVATSLCLGAFAAAGFLSIMFKSVFTRWYRKKGREPFETERSAALEMHNLS